MLLLTLVFAAVALIACVLWPRWPEPPIGSDAPLLPITIANIAFNIPAAAMRVPLQRRPGAHDRVDLACGRRLSRPIKPTRLAHPSRQCL
jgi:hypothetical protein